MTTNGIWKSFPLCELTTSGLIQMDEMDGEVELRSVKNVELRCTSSSSSSTTIRLSHLTCTVTTHRFIFASTTTSSSRDDDGRPRFIHLSNVMNLEESGGSWFTNSSFKILMTLSTSRGIEMAIVFGGGGNDRD